MLLLALLLACGTPASSTDDQDSPVDTETSGYRTQAITDCAKAPDFATDWQDCGLQAACAACVGDCPTDCAFEEDIFLDTGIGRFHCGDQDWYMPGQYRAKGCDSGR